MALVNPLEIKTKVMLPLTSRFTLNCKIIPFGKVVLYYEFQVIVFQDTEICAMMCLQFNYP